MTDEHQHHHEEEESALQGYFDWQVNTLLLAYDLMDPLPGNDQEAADTRRMKTEQEVRDFTLAVVPRQYLDNPELDWPPEVMMAITRATFDRVNQITAG